MFSIRTPPGIETSMQQVPNVLTPNSNLDLKHGLLGEVFALQGATIQKSNASSPTVPDAASMGAQLLIGG